jgi:glycosyltransferase involved in cell wall biosynthesis
MTGVRILHIANTAWFLRYLLLNQLRSLRDAGYEVTAVSPPGPEGAELEKFGIHFIPIAMTRSLTPGADLVSLGRLYHAMRRGGFAIVHTHNPKPGLLGQLAARLAGVPIVVNTLHGFYFHDNVALLKRRFYVGIEKVAASCSDLILSVSREDVGTALREHICRPGRIRHLILGVDVERFDRQRLDAAVLARTRRDLGLPDDAPVVGFVGRLVAEKGVRELLQAARSVLERVPRTRFLLIGPVDTEKPDALTPAVARAYGVEAACVFPGMREDMPELYGLMDVFVLPSHREGFPRALMEASAMGVPCVATDVRGCREAVEPGRNGALVPLGDVPALADAIVDFLDRPAEARRLGAEGRRFAQERFDERLVFDKVKAEYARLLHAKRAAVPVRMEVCR